MCDFLNSWQKFLLIAVMNKEKKLFIDKGSYRYGYFIDKYWKFR